MQIFNGIYHQERRSEHPFDQIYWFVIDATYTKDYARCTLVTRVHALGHD